MQVKLFLLCRVRQDLLFFGTGGAELQDREPESYWLFKPLLDSLSADSGKLMHPRGLFPLSSGLPTVEMLLGMAEGTSPPHSLCRVLCCCSVCFTDAAGKEVRAVEPLATRGTFEQEGTC